ncbi:hypothetical protein U1872_16895 [Sphingomonas sp. RB3P16]|uniref:hypothetical protein n=1 Tax=Parasphingomonas frigoris TaxID=3096163 RepID=UPI002FC9A9D2
MRSIRTSTSVLLLANVALVGGCASHRVAPVAMVAPPPPPVAVAIAPPAGSYAGMPIPARLADGSYETPNRAVTPAATTWHFRAGLNVAALACRGPDDAVLVARYNAILERQRSVLRDAEAQLSGEYRSNGGAAWRERYDHSMTVLYNFFSQGFAHDAFCATAARILAESETIAPAAFPAFAAARLPALDAVFTDFYARYDTWRATLRAAPTSAPAPIMASVGPAMPPRSTVPTQNVSWIKLNRVALLPDPAGNELRAPLSSRVRASVQPSR